MCGIKKETAKLLFLLKEPVRKVSDAPCGRVTCGFSRNTAPAVVVCFILKGLFENTRIRARQICGGGLDLFDLDQ